jgi:hypothetical protein
MDEIFRVYLGCGMRQVEKGNICVGGQPYGKKWLKKGSNPFSPIFNRTVFIIN